MFLGPDVAVQILDSLGLSATEIVAATPQGIANQTWLCGEWVVRISKDPEYLEDLLTESVAAPAAVASGVRTPVPVHFCLQGQGSIPPFSVWQRVAGQTLS
ncbi:MAG: phosphotransferase, partial [Fimbriimonas sp.]